jgi:triacylglycerol lipase
VFCHGLLGFDSVSIGPAIAPVEVTHWRGVKEVLEANGCEVLITRVPATSSPEDRAKVLEKRVSEVYPGRKVHLIGTWITSSISDNTGAQKCSVGHSMVSVSTGLLARVVTGNDIDSRFHQGGIDCRYLTTHLKDRKFEVASVTTIASPHRGCYFADHFLSLVGTSRMPSVLGLLDMLPNGGGDGKAFESLTVANMKQFNEQTPDVEGVRYFSWGATYTPGLIDTWRHDLHVSFLPQRKLILVLGIVMM